MKVAVVADCYHPTRDGVVTSIDAQKRIFDSNGIESVIIAPDPGRPEDRIDGVHYFKSIKFKNYEGYFVPIYPSNKVEVLQDIDPDVIHIQGAALMALKGIIAAHHLKIPVVMTFHTMVADSMKYYSPIKLPEDIGKKLVWKYMKYISKWVDVIIAPTPSIEKEIREHGIKKEIRVIPTPIRTEQFRPDVDCSFVMEKYGLNGKRVIACVGRTTFEKNIDLLIHAMKEMDEDVVLMIVGSGPAMDSLKQLSKELGLEYKVIFVGYVPYEELPQYYVASDVFASASKFETQGLTTIEAMACGIPVACADARAFSDYVKHGENGFLFNDTLEDCVEKLRMAFSASDEVKENAIRTASFFSPESYLEKTLKLYNDVMERRRKKK